MLVLYDDDKNYPCKLIAVIPGDQNNFDWYHLVVQEASTFIDEGSVLFIDYKVSPELSMIDADMINGPCFVIETDAANGRVSLARERETWPSLFTTTYQENGN